jgi:hypothetical protein
MFETRRCVVMGMVRFVADVRDARLEFGFVKGGVVEMVLARASDGLEAFFCNDGGRERVGIESFLRNCSDEAGRSCWRLAEALSTGNREEAGRGIPERMGSEDGGVSMVEVDGGGYGVRKGGSRSAT